MHWLISNLGSVNWTHTRAEYSQRANFNFQVSCQSQIVCSKLPYRTIHLDLRPRMTDLLLYSLLQVRDVRADEPITYGYVLRCSWLVEPIMILTTTYIRLGVIINASYQLQSTRGIRSQGFFIQSWGIGLIIHASACQPSGVVLQLRFSFDINLFLVPLLGTIITSDYYQIAFTHSDYYQDTGSNFS